MRTWGAESGLTALWSALSSGGPILGRPPKALEAAREAWRQGEVNRAHARAGEALSAGAGTDRAHHILFLTTFVMGDYRGALRHHQAIGASYRRLPERDRPVIEAHLHLGALADAVAFASRRRGVPRALVQLLKSFRGIRIDRHLRSSRGIELV
jgi:hypothetical protein